MRNRLKANPLVHALAALALIFAGPVIAGEGGAATIEELVEMFKGVDSFADLLPMVHPDDQPMLGSMIEMMLAFAPMSALPDEINSENEAETTALAEKLVAEVEALEAKHGLKEPPEDAPAGDTPEGMAMRTRYTFEDVDLAAFITDAEEWLMNTLGEEGAGEMMPDFSQIEDLQVDGDKASATLGGAPMEFARIDGRWYVKIEM